MMEEGNRNFPEECRFGSLDHVLIRYLKRREHNQPQPCPVIDCDLYAINRWELFSSTDEIQLYVFTNLRMKSEKSNDSGFRRTARNRTWRGQYEEDDYADPKERTILIGKKKILSFESRKGPKGLRYVMHEYSLPKQENSFGVLCMIMVEKRSSGDRSSYDERNQELTRVSSGQRSYGEGIPRCANAASTILLRRRKLGGQGTM